LQQGTYREWKLSRLVLPKLFDLKNLKNKPLECILNEALQIKITFVGNL